jgi:hypothetical protein
MRLSSVTQNKLTGLRLSGVWVHLSIGVRRICRMGARMKFSNGRVHLVTSGGVRHTVQRLSLCVCRIREGNNGSFQRDSSINTCWLALGSL